MKINCILPVVINIDLFNLWRNAVKFFKLLHFFFVWDFFYIIFKVISKLITKNYSSLFSHPSIKFIFNPGIKFTLRVQLFNKCSLLISTFIHILYFFGGYYCTTDHWIRIPASNRIFSWNTHPPVYLSQRQRKCLQND